MQSFLLGLIGITVGWIYGLSYPLLFFFLTIVCMQLFEFIVWSNLDNNNIRFITSIFAASLLLLQPIASIFTLYPKQIMYNLLILYVILITISNIYIWKNLKEPLNTFFDMYPAKNRHLVWNWFKKDKYTIINIIIYSIFLFLPLILMKRYNFMIYGLITLGVSMYSFIEENTWGSMWCWLVNLSIIYIGANQLWSHT